jgi:hypothetical protein
MRALRSDGFNSREAVGYRSEVKRIELVCFREMRGVEDGNHTFACVLMQW